MTAMQNKPALVATRLDVATMRPEIAQPEQLASIAQTSIATPSIAQTSKAPTSLSSTSIDHKHLLVGVRLSTKQFAALEVYRATLDDVPSRPQAIRSILTSWLKEKGHL